MSENETKGRFRREFESYYADKQVIPSKGDWILVDAIDRIAADVAAVKAKVDSVAPEDVRHFVESEKAWVGLVEEKRDAAIRERDEARAEVERLKAALAEAIKARDDANAASVNLMDERNAAVTRRDERDKLKALVDELKAACEQWRALAWDQSEVKDAARAESDELRAELDKAKAEVGRLLGELAEAKAETQRIQDEADDREQTEKVKRLNAEIEKMHHTLMNRTWERDIAKAEVERHRAELAARPAANSAPEPRGWLTDEERQIITNLSLYHWGNSGWHARIVPALKAILARAGSPPVVEVPAMTLEVGDANTHTGQYLRGRRDAAVSYRAAMDRAGIQWKEVPRE